MPNLKSRVDKLQMKLDQNKPDYDPDERAKKVKELISDIRATFETLEWVDRNKPPEEQERRFWELYGQVLEIFRKVGIHVPESAQLK